MSAARAFTRAMTGSARKSWLLSISYPSWVLNRILGPFVWVSLSVYAYIGIASPEDISRAFEAATASPDFTGFLIIGQTLFSFFTSMNWRGGMAIERERWYGTFELIMLAPTSRIAFILGESLFGLLEQGWTIFLAMVVATFLFGVDFQIADPFLAFVTIVLTLSAMVALGIFFAGFYVMSRSAGPLAFAIQGPIRFFAGVQFPVAALPAAVQAVSYAIPVTYGLLAVRATLIGNAGWADVSDTLITLAILTVGLFTAGAWMVNRMEMIAKKRGTLHQY